MTRQNPVRFKCHRCAVLWLSKDDESPCWLCGEPGEDYSTIFRPNGRPATSGDAA